VDAVDFDRQVRVQAFAFLDQQRATYGDVLPWSVLSEGFLFDGRRVPFRVRGRGTYPHELAFLLRLPLRGFILSPADLVRRLPVLPR
jgi:hypothetical protein